MPGLGAFALAGAVGGLGQAIVDQANKRREDFLAAQRRQQELADRQMAWGRDDRLRSEDRAYDASVREQGWAREDERTAAAWHREDELTAEERARADEVTDRTIAALGDTFDYEPQSVFDRDHMNPEAVTTLAALEGVAGRTFSINSDYRSPTENENAGGARGSQHMHGNAFDIDVSDMSIEERQELIRQARAVGFGGVGVYENSLHFDVGPTRNWGPNYRAASTPEWALDAVTAPRGSLPRRPTDDQIAVIANGEASPEARDIIAADVAPRGLGAGSDGAVLTNQTWVRRQDGSRIRMGTHPVTGAMLPVPGPDGEPVIEYRDEDQSNDEQEDLSDLAQLQIDQTLMENDLPPEVRGVVEEEVQRQVKEGVNEAAAVQSVMGGMIFRRVTPASGGILGLGAREEQVDQGPYVPGFSGTQVFLGFDLDGDGKVDVDGATGYSGADVDLTAEPERVADEPAPGARAASPPSDPVMPAEPGGVVRVTTQAQRDALPTGARYIGPDGVERIKQ